MHWKRRRTHLAAFPARKISLCFSENTVYRPRVRYHRSFITFTQRKGSGKGPASTLSLQWVSIPHSYDTWLLPCWWPWGWRASGCSCCAQGRAGDMRSPGSTSVMGDPIAAVGSPVVLPSHTVAQHHIVPGTEQEIRSKPTSWSHRVFSFFPY